LTQQLPGGGHNGKEAAGYELRVAGCGFKKEIIPNITRNSKPVTQSNCIIPEQIVPASQLNEASNFCLNHTDFAFSIDCNPSNVMINHA
jgi:hypothetical protein